MWSASSCYYYDSWLPFLNRNTLLQCEIRLVLVEQLLGSRPVKLIMQQTPLCSLHYLLLFPPIVLLPLGNSIISPPPKRAHFPLANIASSSRKEDSNTFHLIFVKYLLRLLQCPTMLCKSCCYIYEYIFAASLSSVYPNLQLVMAPAQGLTPLL